MMKKTDDAFEQRLSRQPLRQMPGEWREEILAAANSSRRHREESPRGFELLMAVWRMVLGRLSNPWAALAALWAVVIAANLSMPSSLVSVMPPSNPSAQMQSLATLDASGLDGDFGSAAAPLAPLPAHPPSFKPAAPPVRPHSERPSHLGFGAITLAQWMGKTLEADSDVSSFDPNPVWQTI
jgi:hypothetical protein